MKQKLKFNIFYGKNGCIEDILVEAIINDLKRQFNFI